MNPLVNLAMMGAAGSGIVATLNLDGHSTTTDTDLAENKDSEAGFRFNSDGTVDRANNEAEAGFVYNQIDDATDWIIPNARAALKTYHIKAVEISESDAPVKTGTMGSWVDLATSPQWDANRDRLAGVGTSQWVVSFAISDDGGSTTLVGPVNYTMNAQIS